MCVWLCGVQSISIRLNEVAIILIYTDSNCMCVAVDKMQPHSVNHDHNISILNMIAQPHTHTHTHSWIMASQMPTCGRWRWHIVDQSHHFVAKFHFKPFFVSVVSFPWIDFILCYHVTDYQYYSGIQTNVQKHVLNKKKETKENFT